VVKRMISGIKRVLRKNENTPLGEWTIPSPILKLWIRQKILVDWIHQDERISISSIGPFLVSRTGDAGWTESRVKEPEYIMTSLKDTTKGVGPLRQPDGCHGSRNPL